MALRIGLITLSALIAACAGPDAEPIRRNAEEPERPTRPVVMPDGGDEDDCDGGSCTPELSTCDRLDEDPCEIRQDCRRVYSRGVWDTVRGCWALRQEFISCEDRDACDPEPFVRRHGETCYYAAFCETCDDCEPCPAWEEFTTCEEGDLTLDVVRIEDDVITELIPLADEQPADAMCDAPTGTRMEDGQFLSPEGLQGDAPDAPQISVLYRLPGTTDECPANGGQVTARMTVFDQMLERAGWFDGLADCSNLYLRAKIRHAAEPFGDYELTVEATDVCDETFSPVRGGLTWTH